MLAPRSRFGHARRSSGGGPAWFDWFCLRDDVFQRLESVDERVFRSEAFPGLWLDAHALLEGDPARVLAALSEGLATPEHAAFVDALAARHDAGPRL